MRILIAEDDKMLCNVVRDELNKSGYQVDVSYDGIDALAYLEQNIYELIILDRMLPGMDGLTLLHKIRENKITTPVLFATALGTIDNRIEGLDAGADDYIIKPFDIKEMQARVRALLRRTPELDVANIVNCGDLTFDMNTNTLTCCGNHSFLSKTEAELLQFLIRNRNIILKRELILARVWGSNDYVMDGNLATYIFFLRRQLNNIHSKVQIKTIHSIGYCLEEKQCIKK